MPNEDWRTVAGDWSVCRRIPISSGTCASRTKRCSRTSSSSTSRTVVGGLRKTHTGSSNRTTSTVGSSTSGLEYYRTGSSGPFSSTEIWRLPSTGPYWPRNSPAWWTETPSVWTRFGGSRTGPLPTTVTRTRQSWTPCSRSAGSVREVRLGGQRAHQILPSVISGSGVESRKSSTNGPPQRNTTCATASPKRVPLFLLGRCNGCEGRSGNGSHSLSSRTEGTSSISSSNGTRNEMWDMILFTNLQWLTTRNCHELLLLLFGGLKKKKTSDVWK